MRSLVLKFDNLPKKKFLLKVRAIYGKKCLSNKLNQ